MTDEPDVSTDSAPAVPAARPSSAAVWARSAFTPQAVVRALLVAAVLIGTTLVVAVIAGLLLLVGAVLSPHDAAAQSTSPSVPLSDVRVTGVPFLTLLLIVAGSILFGVVSGTASLDGASSPLAALGVTNASGAFSSYLPLVGLLVPVLLVTAWFAGWRTPRPAAAIGARLVEGGMAGLTAGIVMTLLALVGSTGVTVSGITIGVTVVSFPLFLGAALSAFAAHTAGTALAARSGSRSLPAFVRGIVGLPRSLPVFAAAPVVVLAAWAGLFTVAAFLGLIVAAIVQGSPALGFAAPILVGTVAVLGAAVGQLGAVQIGGGANVGERVLPSASSVVSVFTPSAPWLLVSLLVALVAALLSALALRRLRPAGELRPLWLLPAAALVGWLALPAVFAVFHASGRASASVFSGSGAIDGGVAWWTALIAAAWGVAIEAIARWVVPAWLERDRPGAARVRLLSLIGVAALVVVVAVGVGVSALSGALFSPQGAANAYLGDLAAGRTDAAALGTKVPALPSRAEDRIQHPTVRSFTESGDSATATVGYGLHGRDFTRSLSLVKRGTTAGVFSHWVVAAPILSTVSVAEPITDAVLVGGKRVGSADGSAEVRLLPGAYRFSVQGTAAKYVALSSPLVLAGSDDLSTVMQRATPALADAVQAKVKQKLQTCVASTKDRPDGCPFAAYPFGDYKDLHWSLDQEPTVRLGSDGTSFLTNGGAVTARYQQKDFFGSGYTSETDHVSLFPEFGRVTVDETGVTIADD